MTWRGDAKLSPNFIFYLGLSAVFIGEVLPIVLQFLGHHFSPAAKQPSFEFTVKGFGYFGVITAMYLFIALIFWALYKFLNWKIVAICAAIFGAAAEFLLFKPHEAGGPNVSANPTEALIFFIIVWPIILSLPYLVYKGVQNKFGNKAIVWLILVVLGLIIVGNIYQGISYHNYLLAHPWVKDKISG